MSGPVRALWCVPASTMAIAAVTVLRAHGDRGGSVLDAVLAICTGASVALWPAALLGLASILAGRRGWSWPTRLRVPDALAPAIGATALVAFAATLVAVALAPEILALAEAYPIDYPQTASALWTTGLVLAGPIATATAIASTWILARALARRGLGWHATRAALVGIVGLALWQCSAGAFFVYFGAPLALALVIAGAIVAAMLLPARGGAMAVGGLVAIATLGFIGLVRPGARSLLLHDARVFPHVHQLGLGPLDGDGDGDMPTWLGGGDCDDGDPRIAISRPEIPGNGLDDNCDGRDRTPAPPPARTPARAGPRPHLLLVTIDTVRADHLELHGYPRPTMPALAALAERGASFERAYSPANHTFFSMMAMLAGQATERMLTPEGGLRYTHWLPESLRSLGYYTVAINSPLVADGKIAPADLRVDEIDVGNFDYAGKNRGTTAKQVADDAIARIRAYKGTGPLALWIHFMDPHAVHESPVRFAGTTTADLYDNELSWVDLHIARILAAAETRWGDDVLVAITSDHGESLGEDRDWGHGFVLRERELHVPLVLAGPGVPVGRRSGPVSTLGLATTLLQLLGQDADPRMDHPGLFAPTQPPVVAENPAFLWNAARMEAALVEPQYTLVWSRTTNTTLLFDTLADPEQRHDLTAALPDERERMLAILVDELERGH